MASAPVPPTLQVKKNERFTRLKEAFESRYGRTPEFYARAPGRVNIIGEHIDYCGYSVLPMAIEQDIVIAVSTKDNNQLVLSNIDSKEYSDYSCATTDITIDKSNPKWYHYFLCGYKGVLDHFKMADSCGMDIMLDGSIPRSAGLSSSSALVCCSGLVTMHANKKSLSKLELADICTHCERYIGTEGGGMDQSISFLAEQGTAKHIEFNPLRATDVQLPSGVVFVISNSCVELNKAATSDFNTRVVECRLASQIIAKSKGLEWKYLKKLGNLQKALGVSLSDMINIVRDVLHPGEYTKTEVCEILGVTTEELVNTSLSQNTLTVESFKLYDRATHVFSETNRVLQFKEICDKQPNDAAILLGKLMNDSHASCRDMYQCSHPDLDTLVQLCVGSGALGSRLTGAGWGGCAVSMVPANQVQSFLDKVGAGYYSNHPDRKNKITTNLFATQPGGGAAIYV